VRRVEGAHTHGRHDHPLAVLLLVTAAAQDDVTTLAGIQQMLAKAWVARDRVTIESHASQLYEKFGLVRLDGGRVTMRVQLPTT
jgi:muramidase (phage lysozyme)